MSSLIWLIPVNYHFFDYASLLNSGLDSIFIASLFCLFFSTLILCNDFNNIYNKILFVLSFMFAVGARGNSLPIIFVFIFLPSLKVIFQVIKKKIKLSDIIKLILPILFFLVIFYYKNYNSLYNYYSEFNFSENPFFIEYFIAFITNIPGIFFHYPHPDYQNLMIEKNYFVISISIIFHLLFLFSFYYVINTKNFDMKILLQSSIFSYFFFLIYGSILWNTPHINLYNALIIWAPLKISIVGLIICLFAINIKQINLSFFILFKISLIFLVYFTIYNNLNNEKYYFKGKKPEELIKFAKFIDKKRHKKPIILYTEPNFISNRLIDFYLLQLDKKPINWFRDKYADDIWSPTKDGSSYTINLTRELKSIFENSDLIFIPINSNGYKNDNRNNIILHGFYRYDNILTDIISENQLSDFEIVYKFSTKKTVLIGLERKAKNSKNFSLIINKDKYFIKVSQ